MGGTTNIRTRTVDGVAIVDGMRLWNYYDLKWGVVTDVDNEGWWVMCHDDGTRAILNGERLCSYEARP